ncbi:hypothetical protein EJ08DRAFT_233710 [Tothia fuscella]|uniref:Uncharacterized protein n=1 Tax=Tothia fuscella TaxID=1048955 RepID=A0A9P4P150_9PEZI|nr:hypothetical protein EJ08DRAFT_233710 [Tothia fuscella]
MRLLTSSQKTLFISQPYPFVFLALKLSSLQACSLDGSKVVVCDELASLPTNVFLYIYIRAFKLLHPLRIPPSIQVTSEHINSWSHYLFRFVVPRLCVGIRLCSEFLLQRVFFPMQE